MIRDWKEQLGRKKTTMGVCVIYEFPPRRLVQLVLSETAYRNELVCRID
jgi:hypothetical protein